MSQQRKIQQVHAAHVGGPIDGEMGRPIRVANGGSQNALALSPKHRVATGIISHRPDIRLRAVFECQPEGVAIFDSRGAFVDVNPAAERILGLTRAQLLDLPIRDPCFRIPGPVGTTMAQCDHPIIVALETNQEVRGSILGIFNATMNETRWVIVNAIPHLCRREPARSEVFAFFSAIAAPGSGLSAIDLPISSSTHQQDALDAIKQLSILSGRERQVLDAVVNGDSNKLIAFNLGISARTVEVHRAKMLMKLRVHHSASAIRIAVTAEFAEDRA